MNTNDERLETVLERQKRGLTLDTFFALIVAFGFVVSFAGVTYPSIDPAEGEHVGAALDWSECEPLAGLAGERLC